MVILLEEAELQFHSLKISAESSEVEMGIDKLFRLPLDKCRVDF